MEKHRRISIGNQFKGILVSSLKKEATKYKSLHDVVSCKWLCFHKIEFQSKNEDKINNFCSLNRLNCKIDQTLINKFYGQKLSACIKQWWFARNNTRKVECVYSNDVSQVFNMCPECNIN